MAKVRVYELAKELDVSNKELLAQLDALGIEAKSHSSSISEEDAEKVRAGAPALADEPAPEPPVEEIVLAPAKPAEVEVEVEAEPAPEVIEVAEVEIEPEPVAEPVVETAEEVVEAEPEPAVASEPEPEPAVAAGIEVERGVTVQEFADAVDSSAAEIVGVLMELGEMKTATQSLSDEEVELLAEALDVEVSVVSAADAEADAAAAEDAALSASENAEPRPPVVTVMGHVDHGKTSILDVIRSARVAAGEAGGITQHIGAYQVEVNDEKITFIDTPGHEAFTAMRARGASVTDIAVLVVAADDGMMPQTIEAISHAQAAGVPIVVAVNKIDKDNADPARVRQQLSEKELVPVEWGGETEFVDVSAKENLNIDGLLETIAVVAELEELKADPTVSARGTVVESYLDKGRGPVATVIVRQGTLGRGDIVGSGGSYGKVRALLDDAGEQMQAALPATPTQILGLDSVPEAGDEFHVWPDEKAARQHAAERDAAERRAAQVGTPDALTLESLFEHVQTGDVSELVLLLKADVQGSLEAVSDALVKLSNDEVKVNLVLKSVGGISESDVRLAEASGGLILGFNVRPDRQARDLADEAGVEIRTYRVIYELVEEIAQALTGMLAPEFKEVLHGQAEVRALFRVPRVGVAAGCYVQEGKILRNSKARVVRDGTVVYDGEFASLRRFKDNVNEVASGYECGIGVENFQDVKEGDVIESYSMEEIARQ